MTSAFRTRCSSLHCACVVDFRLRRRTSRTDVMIISVARRDDVRHDEWCLHVTCSVRATSRLPVLYAAWTNVSAGLFLEQFLTMLDWPRRQRCPVNPLQCCGNYSSYPLTNFNNFISVLVTEYFTQYFATQYFSDGLSCYDQSINQ